MGITYLDRCVSDWNTCSSAAAKSDLLTLPGNQFLHMGNDTNAAVIAQGLWPGFQESNTKLPGKGNSNYTLIRKSQTEFRIP